MRAAMALDRVACVNWYQRNRLRSRELFDCARPAAYYDRPIPLRNPICFYEGHLPAFSINTLLKRGLKEPGIDPDYEVLFERGIDPEDASAAGGSAAWPSRDAILRYAEQADRAILRAFVEKPVERGDDPVLRGGLAVYTVLEHEPMHQETLRYMWHRLPFEKKVRPADAPRSLVGGSVPRRQTVSIPAGVATLGTSRQREPFGWDNEFPEQRVAVPAFEIDVHDVTNQDYLEFIEARGYETRALWSEEGWQWRMREQVGHPLFWERADGRWLWRGMFERLSLPMAWPVYVSHAEAEAYARWMGRKLPTEAEFHRAAYGTPQGLERSYPWGEEPPDETRGNFDFRNWDPVPVGSHPAGASAWGVHDLVGNGWEWTSTVFEPFPGFEPMPSYPVYSTDFFDGRHFVMKGASPATAKELLRRGFRNWFRGNYPYVYATFRTAK
jgi:gamma-glutamyl hercynylcysteine S-oxide synthase